MQTIFGSVTVVYSDPAIGGLLQNAEGLQITFDTTAGAVEKLELTKTLTHTSGPVSIRLPVKFTVTRRSAEEVAEDQRKLAEAKARQEELQKKREAEEALSPAKKVDLYLSRMANPENSSQLSDSLRKLKSLEPVTALRTQVLEAVKPLMSNSSYSVSGDAIQCVGIWGTKANIEELQEFAKKCKSTPRRNALEAIARLGADDSEVAKYFAELFVTEELGHRFEIEMILRKMKKESAEAAILPLLTNEDAEIRSDAADLLGRVGGPKSMQALRDLVKKEKNERVLSSAKMALMMLDL